MKGPQCFFFKLCFMEETIWARKKTKLKGKIILSGSFQLWKILINSSEKSEELILNKSAP